MKKSSLAVAALLSALSTAALVPAAYADNNLAGSQIACSGCKGCKGCTGCKGCNGCSGCGGCSGS
jgi:hypothetical protein